MSPAPLLARCPAKINLWLRVLGRRPDGYHELDTVFQAIEIWDEIEATIDEDFSLVCDDPTIPVDSTNLVLRAAETLRGACGPSAAGRGARLVLRKRIPAGAGLGGGSSDAAGTLLLLDRLWGTGVERERLRRCAAELGADVPFFLAGGRARGRGRGDRIEPLPCPEGAAVLVGSPPFSLSTAEVYGGLSKRLTVPANDVTVAPLSHSRNRPGEYDLGPGARNDLEGVVFDGHPELAWFRDALREAGATSALLSGSGSSLFGLFDGEPSLAAAKATLAARFPRWTLRATRTTSRGAHVVELTGSSGD